MNLQDRFALALRALRGDLRPPRRMTQKAAPYLWMTWQKGIPQWQINDFAGYVQEGYNLNTLIYSAIAYKERQLASVPLRAYSGDPDNPEHLPPAHPLARLLARPNTHQGWGEFQRQRVAYLNLAGNSYTWIDRNPDGTPMAMYNLRPDRVYIVPGAEGSLKGFMYKPEGKALHDAMPMLPQDVIHVKFSNPSDPLEGLGYGLSPLSPLARSADVDNDITGFLKKFFENGAAPMGLLKFNMTLDEGQMARIRSRWQELYGGWQNWSDIGILDESGEYQRIGMTAKEMGFTEIDMRNESRVLGPFGIPPILLGTRVGMERSTMANYEESRVQCWEDTLVPEISLFEGEDQYYLSHDDVFVRYDLSKVPALQKNLPELVQAAHRLWTMGYPANVATAAVGLNLPSISTGDTSYVPMAVQVAGVDDVPQADADGQVEALDDERAGKQISLVKKKTA